MSEMLKDIQEDMKRERMNRMLVVFGKAAGAASVVVILATVAGVLWQNHKQAREVDRTAKFIQATEKLNAGDYKQAASLFGTLADDPASGTYELALLREAQAESTGGDRGAAAKPYDWLAQHHGQFADLGQLLAAQGNGKTVDVTATSPFYFSASEWNGWQMLGAGQKDKAVQAFVGLRNNAATPYSMRERLTEALQALAPESLKKQPVIVDRNIEGAGHE